MTELLPPSLGRFIRSAVSTSTLKGLLLLTNDGDFTNFITAARNRVEKVYEVKVKGVPPEGAIERLRRGVKLEDGTRTAPAKIKSSTKRRRTRGMRSRFTRDATSKCAACLS